MSGPATIRPGTDEYAPYYAGYLAAVPDGDVIATLGAQGASLADWMAARTPAQGRHAYAEGKWTANEVVQHITDSERVFAYRLLRIARADTTPLAGFEQDDWIAPSRANDRTPAQIADEFRSVRAATVALVQSLPDEAWARRGSANGVAVSARALAWMIAGHAMHHERILRERY